MPIILTPFLSTTLSTSDPSTLPPDSTAISKMTLPGIILSIVLLSTNKGAGLPNNCAVVITISDLSHTFDWSSFCFVICSSVSSFAYPWSVSPVSPKSIFTNFAPREFTCSSTTSLVSNASTLAPNLFAVAIAWRPATPTPITNTFAGFRVPAAVIIIGNAVDKCFADSITAT